MPVKPYQRTPGKWLFDYHDAYGKRRYGTAPDERTAEMIQAEREREWHLIRAGVVKAEQVKQARAVVRSLASQITEYEEHLKAKQVTPQHLKNSMHGLRRVIRWLNAGSAMEIGIDKVEAFFNRKTEAGMSPRMRNFYCKLLKAFLQLLMDRDAILRNPLQKLRAMNEEIDQKNVSRPMTHPEFDALLKPLSYDGIQDLTPGRKQRLERRLFYIFVARTGLRWRETARLHWADLDAVSWWLEVSASQTKGKRADSLPVPADLVHAIEQWQRLVPAQRPQDPIFPKGMPTLRTWKSDLYHAGLISMAGRKKYRVKRRKARDPEDGYRDSYAATADLDGYTDKDGCKLHRKCLRLTFGTWLYEAGVDVREAQRLMRHRDINLTSKIYTRPRLSNLEAAADRVARARIPSVTAQVIGRVG